jgi:hypothetical protein
MHATPWECQEAIYNTFVPLPKSKLLGCFP